MRRRLRGLWRWAAAHQFLVALALIGAVVAAAFWRDSYLDAEQDRRVSCIGEWGDAVADRAARLVESSDARTDAADARADALDLMLRDVADQILTGRQDQEAFRANLVFYVKASDEYRGKRDAYRRARAENPVPEPPRIRC